MLVRDLLLASLLFTAGLAQAELDHDGIKQPSVGHQNLSKRPYAAPVDKTEKYQGDTATEDTARQERNRKTLNLHMLGKRPWAEKNTD